MALTLRSSTSAAPRFRRFLVCRHFLYDDVYFWLALATAVDVFLTWALLALGRPLNVVTAVLVAGGLRVLILYKAALLTGVVLLCEEIGRRRPTTGRRVADLVLAVTCLSALLNLIQLLAVFRPF